MRARHSTSNANTGLGNEPSPVLACLSDKGVAPKIGGKEADFMKRRSMLKSKDAQAGERLKLNSLADGQSRWNRL